MRVFHRVSLAVRVYSGYIALALLVSVVGTFMLYRGAQDALRQEVQDRLKQEAVSAASQIDPVMLSCLRAPGRESTDAYTRTSSALHAIRLQNPELGNIRILCKDSKGDCWRLLVDTQNSLTRLYRPFKPGNSLQLASALANPTADTQIRHAAGRDWISGYAPVCDALGSPQAVLQLDATAQGILAAETHLLHTAVKVALAALLLAMVVSVLVTRAMVKPVHMFTEAAERVRGGDLDFEVTYTGSPETTRFAGVFNGMIAGLKESHDRLMELATRDVVTGLFNHMYFQERLSVEVERSELSGGVLCLLILDIDRFKTINDTLGHTVGDSVLRQLADVLQECTRHTDLVARYGGDELAIILTDTELETGLARAELIRASVQDHLFWAVPASQINGVGFSPEEKKPVNVTVTVGMSAFPSHHNSRDGLIMAADIALCRAKHIARNSVCIYEVDSSNQEHIDPQALYQALRDPNAAAIQSLAAAVDAKDRYTCGHSERVAGYAVEIGSYLGLESDLLDSLGIAGMLHDLGKIGVPDSVLNKPGSLTEDERDSIKRHPAVGGNILRRAPQLDVIIPAVIYHHERWDGAGYPDGLAGEAIPLIARIMAVADAFDAMTSERPYRSAMSVESALLELQAGAGKQFEPRIVEAFVESVLAQTRLKAA